MCWCVRFALCGLFVGLTAALSAPAADSPDAILKALKGTDNQPRVRIPTPGGAPDALRFKAKVAHKKTGELIDITVAVDTHPGKSYVAEKTLKAWGYEVPKNKQVVLAELIIPAVQVSPEVKKGGRDVHVKLNKIKLHATEPPADAKDQIYDCTISLTASNLYVLGTGRMQPRLSFSDHFLELTVPTGEQVAGVVPFALKRLGTADLAVPEVTADPAPKLVAVTSPMVARGGVPVFAHAEINGMKSYKLGSGADAPVDVSVSSLNNWDTGLLMTIGLARGCKVKMDQKGKANVGVGVDAQSEMIPGKIDELRLGFKTADGKDRHFVLKDVPVMIDTAASEGDMWIGAKFLEKHFKDAVYACGPDGVWKLYGRCDPEVLFDPKTRPKKP